MLTRITQLFKQKNRSWLPIIIFFMTMGVLAYLGRAGYISYGSRTYSVDDIIEFLKQNDLQFNIETKMDSTLCIEFWPAKCEELRATVPNSKTFFAVVAFDWNNADSKRFIDFYREEDRKRKKTHANLIQKNESFSYGKYRLQFTKHNIFLYAQGDYDELEKIYNIVKGL